jgi:hypothetical protein
MTAPSNSPIYTTGPLCPFNTVQSGNTNTDGFTGLYSSGLTIGANGALIDYIKFMPLTTVSGILRIFYSNNQSGFNGASGFALWDAVTYASGTTTAQYWFPGGSTLWAVAPGSLLKFSVTVNDTWNVWTHYTNY